MKPYFKFLCLAILSAGLFSCVNLQSVSEFSGKSVTAIDKISESPVNLSSICQEKCYQETILDPKNIPFPEEGCSCQTAGTKDSIIRVELTYLKTYFKALHDLSQNEVMAFKGFNDLSNSLDTIKAVGGRLNVKFSNDQKKAMDAFTMIAKLFTKIITDKARQTKIIHAVERCDSSISVILDVLIAVDSDHLNDIKIENVINQRMLYYGRLFNAAQKDTILGKTIQHQIKRESYEFWMKMQGMKKEVRNRIQIYTALKKGHNELKSKIKTKDPKEIAKILAPYLTEINTLIYSLNQSSKK